jgi:hypothetical protein
VSAGVLVMLFTRAEGREYELPGGDGTVILVAGAWAALLLFWRVFDRPDVGGEASTVGIQWGFFVAFLAAGGLAAAGWRLRQHERNARPAPPTSRRPREPRPPEEEPTARQQADAAPDRLF